MKISTTLITSVDCTIDRDGETVGALINHILTDCLDRGEVATNVSIAITPEDWIALRLRNSPADHTVRAKK